LDFDPKLLETIGSNAIGKAHAQKVHMLTITSSAIYVSEYLSYLIKSGVQAVGLILGTCIKKYKEKHFYLLRYKINSTTVQAETQ
jgi:hypothetical protein